MKTIILNCDICGMDRGKKAFSSDFDLFLHLNCYSQNPIGRFNKDGQGHQLGILKLEHVCDGCARDIAETVIDRIAYLKEESECEECEGAGQRAFATDCHNFTPCPDCKATGRVSPTNKNKP